MNKMGPAFTNDNIKETIIPPSSNENNYENRQLLPTSGFRDVALSSLIPQVVSELLGMDYCDSPACTSSSSSIPQNHDVQNGGDNVDEEEEKEENEDNLRMLRYVCNKCDILCFTTQ